MKLKIMIAIVAVVTVTVGYVMFPMRVSAACPSELDRLAAMNIKDRFNINWADDFGMEFVVKDQYIPNSFSGYGALLFRICQIFDPEHLKFIGDAPSLMLINDRNLAKHGLSQQQPITDPEHIHTDRLERALVEAWMTKNPTLICKRITCTRQTKLPDDLPFRSIITH